VRVVNDLERLVRQDLTGVARAVEAHPEPVTGTLRAARRARRVRTGVRTSAALATVGALAATAVLAGPGLVRSREHTPPAATLPGPAMTLDAWLDTLPRGTDVVLPDVTDLMIRGDGRLVDEDTVLEPDEQVSPVTVAFQTPRGLLVSWSSAVAGADNAVTSLGWLPPGADRADRVVLGGANPALSPDGTRYAHLSFAGRGETSRTWAVIRDATTDAVVAERTLPGVGHGWVLVDWNAAGVVLQDRSNTGGHSSVPLVWQPGTGTERRVTGWRPEDTIPEGNSPWGARTDLVVVRGESVDPADGARLPDEMEYGPGGERLFPFGSRAVLVSLSRPDRRIWEGSLVGISPDGRYLLDSRTYAEKRSDRRGVDLVSVDTGRATPLVPRNVRLTNEVVVWPLAWDDQYLTIRIRYERTSGSLPELVIVQCTVPELRCHRAG